MASRLEKELHTGTIFNGLVDCYVLENERRLISQRGALRALSGGAGNADFGRYLSRLPSQYAHLSSLPTCEFRTPRGPTAHGITPEQFIEILDAYVEAGLAGLLHESQLPLARNANNLRKGLSLIGLIAMIDEATGYQRARADDALTKRLNAFLLEKMSPHKTTWKAKLIYEIARLYGYPQTSDRAQPWMKSVMDKVYRHVLNDEVKDEMKARNPEPRFGSNHHQLLRDPARELLAQDLEIVHAIALTSRNANDFWQRMGWHYGRRTFQMDLPPSAVH